ncbi:adenylate/guanylate cyclase domain-containing protein [Hoeflea sp. TYP-13]|uniref:adenylate/guanylate cyclase domain-containing protein n=1 Tax=Hoeflea sp. TYP-13 TaxID=3230023 RepID=UPI0034C5DCBD
MAYPERSIVTVMVVDAVSSTNRIASVDPDDAQLMVDDVLTHIRSSVEKAGGLLVSFAGDGGVAVFGWPESHEDHADRACEAAWNIQHPYDENNPVLDPDNNKVQFRVGVHSGLVGLRNLELERGSQLDLVGGTVHLAARLEKSAEPGEILISEDTIELCRLDFKHKPRSDLKILDEISSSVSQMCAPANRRAANGAMLRYTNPIVGRERERKTIGDAIFGDATQNRIYAIIGEPGIGKSRLAIAVIDEAVSKNSVDQLLVFRGDMQKRTTPFAVLRSLILNALKLDEQSPGQRIEKALGEAGFDFIEPGVLETMVMPDKRELSGGGDSHLSLKETAKALVETFAQVGLKGRTVLLIEDLHLVDPESLVCLEMLKAAASEQPLFVLVTGRPEAAYDAQQIADNVFRLEPMSRNQMRQLARQLWSDETPSEQNLEKVLDQADGIPFVLEQLACSIGTEDPDSILSIPQSVQSMIHARLNRLPPTTKYCAQALSILGEEVELEFAGKVLGMESKDLMKALTDLEKLAITNAVAGRTVRFRHSIIADACSITVPRSRRTDVHKAAIETIKATYPDLGGQYERLAFHAEAAGDDLTALEFFWLAGNRANRSAAGKSLQLIFDRALECIERVGEPAEKMFVNFTLMVCASLLQLGEFSKMHSHLPRAMELATKQGRKNQICAAMCHIAMVDWFEGRYEDGVTIASEALDMAETMESLPHIFAAQHVLSVLHHAMGDMDRALSLQRSLCDQLSGELETAQLGATGIPGAISRAFLGWFLTEIGEYEESHEYALKSLEISKTCNNSYSEVISLNALGRNQIMTGRTSEAVESLQQAMTIVDRHGYDAPKPHITGLLSTALARSGRADEALDLVEDCFKKALHLRTGRLEIYYLYAGYAEALFRSGAVERSMPAIDQAIEIGRSINNPSLIAQGLALRAQISSSIKSNSPLLKQDIEEHRMLCAKHGFKALV